MLQNVVFGTPQQPTGIDHRAQYKEVHAGRGAISPGEVATESEPQKGLRQQKKDAMPPGYARRGGRLSLLTRPTDLSDRMHFGRGDGPIPRWLIVGSCD